MATPRKDPADHLPRGRPKLIPADARNRTIRCTDAEYRALMCRLAELRAAENAGVSSTSQQSG